MNHSKFAPGPVVRFALLCLFCLFSFHPIASAQNIEEIADFSLLLHQPAMIKSGDIIFRQGNTAGSRIVDMVDEDSLYSHVGLIQVVGGEPFVIHAIPEKISGEGWVRRDPLASFLADSTAVALYRLQSAYRHLGETAVAETLPWIDRIPFDASFDLTSAETLYCTELVWLAYQRAGIDLVDNKFDTLDLPFSFSGAYLLPSRLSQSPYLQVVLQIPNNLEAK